MDCRHWPTDPACHLPGRAWISTSRCAGVKTFERNFFLLSICSVLYCRLRRGGQVIHLLPRPVSTAAMTDFSRRRVGARQLQHSSQQAHRQSSHATSDIDSRSSDHTKAAQDLGSIAEDGSFHVANADPSTEPKIVRTPPRRAAKNNSVQHDKLSSSTHSVASSVASQAASGTASLRSSTKRKASSEYAADNDHEAMSSLSSSTPLTRSTRRRGNTSQPGHGRAHSYSTSLPLLDLSKSPQSPLSSFIASLPSSAIPSTPSSAQAQTSPTNTIFKSSTDSYPEDAFSPRYSLPSSAMMPSFDIALALSPSTSSLFAPLSAQSAASEGGFPSSTFPTYHEVPVTASITSSPHTALTSEPYGNIWYSPSINDRTINSAIDFGHYITQDYSPPNGGPTSAPAGMGLPLEYLTTPIKHTKFPNVASLSTSRDGKIVGVGPQRTMPMPPSDNMLAFQQLSASDLPCGITAGFDFTPPELARPYTLSKSTSSSFLAAQLDAETNEHISTPSTTRPAETSHLVTPATDHANSSIDEEFNLFASQVRKGFAATTLSDPNDCPNIDAFITTSSVSLPLPMVIPLQADAIAIFIWHKGTIPPLPTVANSADFKPLVGLNLPPMPEPLPATTANGHVQVGTLADSLIWAPITLPEVTYPTNGLAKQTLLLGPDATEQSANAMSKSRPNKVKAECQRPSVNHGVQTPASPNRR